MQAPPIVASGVKCIARFLIHAFFFTAFLPAPATVLRLAPERARADFLMAMAGTWLGETRPTLPFFEQAVRSEPRLAQLPDFLDLLSRNYLTQGSYDGGLKTFEQAARLAATVGHSQPAAKLQQRAEECRRLGGTEKR